MPSDQPTRRTRPRIKRPRPQGILREGELGTPEGAWIAGKLCKKTLSRARQSGMVTAIWAGNYVYYKSSELIKWILSHEGKAPAYRMGKRVPEAPSESGGES